MRRISYKFSIDLLIWILATPLAYMLRLEGSWNNYIEAIFWVSAVAIPFKLIIILYEKFYIQSWHRVGLKDLFIIFRGVLVYTAAFLITAVILRDQIFIPYSVPLIEAMLLIMGLGSVRLINRLWFEYKFRIYRIPRQNDKRVLIAGAGDAGTMIARQMLRHPIEGMDPIGFLDDDPAKQKQRFLGLNVLGGTDRASVIIRKYDIDMLLIAMPSETGDVVRKLVKKVRNNTDLEYKILPTIQELISGEVSINEIRDINLEDLLRRKPVDLHTKDIAGYLNNRVILVTGAGGSIGSEIARQIIPFEPKKLLLLGRGEYSIYKFEQELRKSYPGLNYHPVIADIRDVNTLASVFDEFEPEIVFHAAAHKHVPLMEKNPSQAILNNIGGTKNLVNLSLEYNVPHFVNISTDKAVNPTSVMGASKRVAEYIVEWGSRRAQKGQTLVSVRFGNVLGSRGSVIPKFKEQIKQREPITITHPEMSRYFMTISEASQLVLQAGGLNQTGAVYVLEMGEPVKIMDLAKDLIRLSGFEPEVDIPIDIVGKRPGEKMYEELLTAEEGTEITRYEKIRSARQNGLPQHFERSLDELINAALENDKIAIRNILMELIPTGKLNINTDSKRRKNFL